MEQLRYTELFNFINKLDKEGTFTYSEFYKSAVNNATMYLAQNSSEGMLLAQLVFKHFHELNYPYQYLFFYKELFKEFPQNMTTYKIESCEITNEMELVARHFPMVYGDKSISSCSTMLLINDLKELVGDLSEEEAKRSIEMLPNNLVQASYGGLTVVPWIYEAHHAVKLLLPKRAKNGKWRFDPYNNASIYVYLPN